MVLSSRRNAFQGLAGHVGRFIGGLGIKPNHVTLLALLVSGVGAFFLFQQQFILGSLIVAVGACLDFVDGAVARATDNVTKTGGYLDSVLDRFVDFAVLLGILAGFDETKYWLVGSVALFGAITTSFAKARVYEDIQPDKSEWSRDMLQRSERYLLLLPALMAQGILLRLGHGIEVVFWVLVVFAVLSVATVLQRMRTAMRLLSNGD